jgi:mRNA-degrading endonuclease toxin of MazEF toxin-antitoxin module
MTRYEVGEVILFRVQFSDEIGGKQRPAVVVSSDAFFEINDDLLVIPITSQLSDVVDASVADWQEAGLVKPSALKWQIACVGSSLVVRSLGHLTEPDMATVRSAVRAMLSPKVLH